MAQSSFTKQEREYLLTLPAVLNVSSSRIQYTQRFRDEFVRRYANGESSTAIFRSVGLESSLIGGKRIERCTARWVPQEYKEMHRLNRKNPKHDETAYVVPAMTKAVNELRRSAMLPMAPSLAVDEGEDSRDAVIARQALLIHQLEQTIVSLMEHNDGSAAHQTGGESGGDARFDGIAGDEARGGERDGEGIHAGQ
ncbi:methyltransferase [Bifidobacterium lemurum]|uniref:Methyltransferase n=2 Tax=Bifidobacterium lemurum TaxID=1603886 RepID=A0A261FNL1_9BIFI|nr:HTH domain-containing protein [Bifidobacterium lemurum]OZG60678.1 methyltransferase [Bifidobacterium lemurum]